MKNVKNKANREHVYFDSRINKEKEVHVIIESSIGFNSHDFRNRIQDELNFLGMEWVELAESCYLKPSRIYNLMKGIDEFEYYEINVISKRLGF
jgi:predicted transcriptional regulator